ncbi:hypothetical protein CY35_10G002600 [Sphagnum magellanicum]|nr:hypothetical protein CY35_10G002600 [Sphagnum magellanicum]
MLDSQKKEPVPEGALRQGTSDYDSQDSKSHNSQKQKQVASDDDGGNGVDGVRLSSSGSSSQSRRGSANGQYAGSDLPAAEDLILVEEYTDHTTITAEASRNIGVAAKAKDLNTSLLTSDEMKKLEPMAEPPPINFDPDGDPDIQFGDINYRMLLQISSNGDMVDGSKQSDDFIPSFELNLSRSGGINPSRDVRVLNADNAPQEPYASELGLKDSPPLMDPSVSPWSPREKQLYAMYAEEKAHLEEFKELGCYSSKHLLIVCAAEIFKWSVNLRGEERGDGRQLFRPDLTEPVTDVQTV